MFKIKLKLAGEDLVSFNAPSLPPPEEEYAPPAYDEEAAERKRRKRERRERERAAAAAAEAAYGDGGRLEPLYLKPKAPRPAGYGGGFGASGSEHGGATGHKSQLQLLLDMQRNQQFGGADTQAPGGFGSFSAPFGSFGAPKSSRKREREREQHAPFAKQPSEALRRPPPPRRSAEEASHDGGERRRRGLPTPSAPVPYVVRSARAGGPDQPKRHLLEAAVAKLSKVDREGFFQDPVTDAIAPGYSSVVARPMDFTTIRLKMRADAYGSWDELSEDVSLIVSNCLLYNAAGTVFTAAAERLKEAAEPIIKGYKCAPMHLRRVPLQLTAAACRENGGRPKPAETRRMPPPPGAHRQLARWARMRILSPAPAPTQRHPSRDSCALRRRRCSWCRRSLRARRRLLARSPPLATPRRRGPRSPGRRQRRRSLPRLGQPRSWRTAGAASATTRTGAAPSDRAATTRAC